jgi:hypothetical protein
MPTPVKWTLTKVLRNAVLKTLTSVKAGATPPSRLVPWQEAHLLEYNNAASTPATVGRSADEGVVVGGGEAVPVVVGSVVLVHELRTGISNSKRARMVLETPRFLIILFSWPNFISLWSDLKIPGNT